MTYIVDSNGTLVSVPQNTALPAGARWADADEVAQWEQADRIRAAAGIPAPKSAQQAQLEYNALQENIRNRGGLATPQEIANLNMLQEQIGQGGDPPQATPTLARGRQATAVDPSSDLPDGVTHVVGRGANAGDQYTQYETVPDLAKVVTDEAPDNTPQARSADAAKVAPVGNADNVTSRASVADIASSEPPPLPEGKRDLPNSTPKERAENSPTAKSKEK